MKKTLMKIALGFVAFIALILIIVFSSTSGIADAADSVITQLNNGDVHAVYDASAMTEEFTFEEFSAAMGVGAEYDITTVEKVGWTGRGFENNEKYIYGDFTFGNGETMPLTFWFVEGDNGELVLLGITGGIPESASSSDSDF